MAPLVTVVGGMVASERSRRLGEFYAEALKQAQGEQRLGTRMWIAPHALAAQRVPSLLRGVGIDACLSPGVTTLRQLSEAIVSTELTIPTILPTAATRWLIRQAIELVHQRGGLTLLASAIDRPGLVDAVEGTIEQWKARGIDSAEAGRLAGEPGGGRREQELATIYREYAHMLALRHAADRFDLPRLAAQTLATRPREGSSDYELLLIELGDALTHDEYALLEQLVARSRQVLVSLPLEAAADEHSAVRQELLAPSHRQLSWLRSLGGTLRIEFVPPDQTAPAELSHLRDQLFQPPDQQASRFAGVPQHVGIHPRADAAAEVAAAARQIKHWILVDGVAPDEIVLATPSLSSEQSRIAETLKGYGLPFWIDKVPTVGESPAIVALALLLGLHVADWPYRQLLEVITCRLFKAFDRTFSGGRWPTVRGTTEWLIRELQIARGRVPLVEYVKRLAEAEEESPLARGPRQQGARLALGPLQRLVESLEGLPPQATPREWMAALEGLAAQVGLELDGQPGGAWRSVQEAAAWIERAELLGGPASQVGEEDKPGEAAGPLQWSPAECLELIRDMGRWLPYLKPQRREARVAVTSLWSARHLRPRHLVVIGMGEKALASSDGGRGLLSEEQLERLGAEPPGTSPPPLPTGSTRAMRLFFELVTSPQESLTFSYAALDNRGQQMPPSPLLLELCQALGPAWVKQLERPPALGQLADEGGVPLSPKEWRLRAVADLRAPAPTFTPLAGLLTAPQTRLVAQNLVQSLRAIDARASGDGFGAWEGMVISSAAQRHLASRFGPESIWSASQLETYAECPYRFYLRYVLGIAEQEDLMLTTDHRQQGSLAHDTLKALHERLREEIGLNQQPLVDRPAFDELYEQSLQTALTGMAQHGPEGVLVEILAHQVRKWESGYYEQQVAYQTRCRDWDLPLVPRHLELRFGPASRQSDAAEDPHSVDTPFQLTVGAETIRFAGRIDRIDVGEVGGRLVFQIIDYKTAREVRLHPAELQDGRSLQPTLYAMVASVLLSDGQREAVPLASGYWGVRDKGFHKSSTIEMHAIDGGELRPTELWQQLQQEVAERVGQIVAGIRQGEFPMYPAHEKICSRCEFRRCCRVQQARSLEKLWPGPARPTEPTPPIPPV